MAITITIQPVVTDVAIESPTTSVTANLAIAPLAADSIVVSPTGKITATTLQGAIEQLAESHFQQATIPSGSNIEEGDIWYNTDTNSFFVYREIASETFDWVPIMVGDISADSDTVDAGAF